MSIKVACPKCRKPLNAPEGAIGKRGRCKFCGTVFLVQASVTAGSPTRFDLGKLRIPHQSADFEKTLQIPEGLSSISSLSELKDLASQLGENKPFCSTNANGAFAIVREDSFSNPNSARQAIQGSRIICIPNIALFPTYPILSVKFAVYDQPQLDPKVRSLGILSISTGPLLMELFADITSNHIQRFLAAVLENGNGSFGLFSGKGNAIQCVAIGAFSLRSPPPSLREKAILNFFSFRGQTFPYGSTVDDYEVLSNMLSDAANHLAALTPLQRNFEAGVKDYLLKSNA